MAAIEGPPTGGFLTGITVALVPLLVVVLIVPLVTGGATAGSTVADVLVVSWLVVAFVVFVLGASLAAVVVREGRRDPALEALRLGLATGEVDPGAFDERWALLEQNQ